MVSLRPEADAWRCRGAGSSLPTFPGSAQLPSGRLTAPAGSVWDALRASRAGREDTFLSAEWAGAPGAWGDVEPPVAGGEGDTQRGAGRRVRSQAVRSAWTGVGRRAEDPMRTPEKTVNKVGSTAPDLTWGRCKSEEKVKCQREGGWRYHHPPPGPLGPPGTAAELHRGFCSFQGPRIYWGCRRCSGAP